MKTARILCSWPFYLVAIIFLNIWSIVSGIKECPFCSEWHESKWWEIG